MSPILSEPLTTYRFYCFDRHKKTVTADFIRATDDQDAVTKARAQGFGSKCEVWNDRRLVAALMEEPRSFA